MQFNRLFRPINKTPLTPVDIFRLQQQQARSRSWSERNSHRLGAMYPEGVPQSLAPTRLVAQLRLFNFWHDQVIRSTTAILQNNRPPS